MSKVQMIRLSAVTFVLGMTVAAALPAAAKTVEIQMKNNGTGGMMVFEPSYVVAKPGDTIRFVPTNPGHNAETIAGMIPAGAEPATGAMSKALEYKVAKPGLYGFECKPHFGMGMVALVKVGTGAPANLKAASAVTLPPLAAKRMAPMLASAAR